MVGASSGLPRSPARVCGDERVVGVPPVGVGDRDAARDAGLLTGDEREPGEQVRGAQRGWLVAA